MKCWYQILGGTFSLVFSVILPISQGDQCSRPIYEGNSFRKRKCPASGSQSPGWWGKLGANIQAGSGGRHTALLALPFQASVYPSITVDMRGFCSWLWWPVMSRKQQPCFYSVHMKNSLNDLHLKPFSSLYPSLSLFLDICPFGYRFYWELTLSIMPCKPREKRQTECSHNSFLQGETPFSFTKGKKK